MSKMHYFCNKFSKIAKCWGFPPSAPLSVQYWWPEVPWFGQIVVFKADYDEINRTSTYSFDVTKMTFPKNHYVTITSPLRHKFFFQFGPLPIKISGYASGQIISEIRNGRKILIASTLLFLLLAPHHWEWPFLDLPG